MQIRILADELEVTSSELITWCARNGFTQYTHHNNIVSDSDAREIQEKFRRNRNGDSEESSVIGQFASFFSNERSKKWAKIIALLGLVSFAVWQSLPDEIKSSIILQIFQPNPTQNYAFDGVHILHQAVELNLSSWQKVSDSIRRSTPAIPAVWVYTVKARKAKNEDYFYKEIYTSGLKPTVASITHPFTYEEVTYTPSPGRELLSKYLLKIDISKVNQGDEFEIVYIIVAWNAFQNSTKEWAAQLIKYPTDEVQFNVYSPYSKPFVNFTVESYSKRDSSVGKYSGNMPVLVSGSHIQWDIKNPKTFFSYRLIWEW